MSSERPAFPARTADAGSPPPYRVLMELTRGGMGRVLLARRRGAHGFERLVAIKAMRAELRERAELSSMFVDEARLMARLHHPAIAQVHDLIELDGELCLVMEYVPGVSFERLAEIRPPPEVSAEAMAHVLRGLHAAHELCDERGEPMGVVHRDVSPQNLMVDFEGRVKILDFGIAWMRRRQAPVTEYGMVKGKPAYMSPEQLANGPVDRRTDVFCAAVVLHEMLTGGPLFAGDSPFQVAHAMISEPIGAPSARAGTLPAGLDEAVLRGLAREPGARFPTARDMADALDAIVARCGGERLDGFVRRALAAERSAHDERLRDVELERNGRLREPEGRPTGISTALDVGGGSPPGAGDGSRDELAQAAPVRVAKGAKLLLPIAALAVAGAVVLAIRARTGAIEEDAAIASATASVSAPASAAAPASAPASASASVPVSAPAPVPVPAPAPVPGSAAARVPAPAPSVSVPVAATTSAPSTEFGFLTVGANPYALVHLDGVSIGPTPILSRKIPVGTHQVVLVSPDSGAVRLQRTVEVRAGATESVILR